MFDRIQRVGSFNGGAYAYLDHGQTAKELVGNNGCQSTKCGLNWGPGAYIRRYFTPNDCITVVNPPSEKTKNGLLKVEIMNRKTLESRTILDAKRIDGKITNLKFDRTWLNKFSEKLPNSAKKVIKDALKSVRV